MSGKIIMNLAVSLDGYIADEDGGYSWIAGQGDNTLDTSSKNDFNKFLDEIDIVVMGNNCYKQGFTKDYKEKTVYVAASNPKAREGNVSFISEDVVDIINQEKMKGKRIFLFGGGILIDYFMKKNIVDEFIIGIIPIILGKGRPLFLGNNPTIPLLLNSYSIEDGIAVFHYKRR